MTSERIKELRNIGSPTSVWGIVQECLDEIESQAQRIAELARFLTSEVDKTIAAEHALEAARQRIAELERKGKNE